MRKEKQKYANYVYELWADSVTPPCTFLSAFLVRAHYLSLSEDLCVDLEQKADAGVHVLFKEDLQEWESLVSANRSIN